MRRFPNPYKTAKKYRDADAVSTYKGNPQAACKDQAFRQTERGREVCSKTGWIDGVWCARLILDKWWQPYCMDDAWWEDEQTRQRNAEATGRGELITMPNGAVLFIPDAQRDFATAATAVDIPLPTHPLPDPTKWIPKNLSGVEALGDHPLLNHDGF